MTPLALSTLLPPLQNAIAMCSWEDVEDIAGELKRLARIKRLSELQVIQDTLALKKEVKIAPEGSQVANRPIPVSEVEWISAKTGLKANRDKIEAVFEVQPPYRPEPEITLNTRFDEKGHDEEWRNTLAKELNSLLLLPIIGFDGTDHAIACLSLVKRVAEFEGIKTV